MGMLVHLTQIYREKEVLSNYHSKVFTVFDPSKIVKRLNKYVLFALNNTSFLFIKRHIEAPFF